MKILQKIIVVIGILCVIVIGIDIFSYLNNVYDIGLFCVFNKTTGLYCSGCGMTRAVLSLVNLDFYQAFRYNIFSIIFLPIIAIYLFVWIFDKPNIINKGIMNFVWISIVFLLVIYGVLRNIPVFSFLAPTIV